MAEVHAAGLAVGFLLFVGGAGVGASAVALLAYTRATRAAERLMDMLDTLGAEEHRLAARLQEFEDTDHERGAGA